MKLTFRWYGEDDPVTLDHIRQIPGMSGIVSAVYDVEPGNVWSRESIAQIRDQAREKGLTFEVVESVCTGRNQARHRTRAAADCTLL